MIGRQKLATAKALGASLIEGTGMREGELLIELVEEVERLQSSEWSPESLRDALDTTMALYLGSKEGRDKGLGGTTVLELEAWLGAESIRMQSEGMPAIARKAMPAAPDPQHQLLCDEPGSELLARTEPAETVLVRVCRALSKAKSRMKPRSSNQAVWDFFTEIDAIGLQVEGAPFIAAKTVRLDPARHCHSFDVEPEPALLERAQRERQELGDGQVRPFVTELRERGRVTAAEWAVPMNTFERHELLPVLVDSVFIEHLLHGASNVDQGSPGTYNWALVHENVPEALRRWRGYLRELVVRELDERLEHPAPLLHDAALAFARAKNTSEMAQALRALMEGAEAYSKVVP